MESTFPEVERDEAFTQKLADLQFITLAHVEIPAAFAQHESMFELAQVGMTFDILCVVSMLNSHLFVFAEIRKMDSFRAPHDKIVCLLNCCTVLNALIRQVQSKAADAVVSADDFLPLLIYTVIKYVIAV